MNKVNVALSMLDMEAVPGWKEKNILKWHFCVTSGVTNSSSL